MPHLSDVLRRQRGEVRQQPHRRGGGGRPRGRFVMWGPALEPAWFDPGVERWAELDELHVHPGYQGRGIGTRLVRSAVREARAAGFAVMYLVAEASNVSARRVYEKNGFREHNRIVRYKIEL